MDNGTSAPARLSGIDGRSGAEVAGSMGLQGRQALAGGREGYSTMSTPGSPAVALSAEEYQALDFAADMLRARADDLADLYPSFVTPIVRQADVLQALHDRWHRAAVAASGDPSHDVEQCGYCRNGDAS